MHCKKVLYLLLSFSAFFYGEGVKDAHGYHKNSGLQWTAAEKVLEGISWKGNEKVLDVGCGDGKITAFIAENCSKSAVVGVDVSPSMIEFASACYNQKKHGNLVFLTANAAQLPFQEQFDVVTSFSALHWVVHQKEALESIYQSLVSGGKGYILTYGKAPMNLSKLSENLIYSERWSSYFPDYHPQRVYFTAEQYLDLLDEVGFFHIELISKWSQTTYSNRRALVDFVAPLLNFIQHLPIELKTQFVNEVVDQIVILSKPTQDGSIVFEVLKLELSVVKP